MVLKGPFGRGSISMYHLYELEERRGSQGRSQRILQCRSGTQLVCSPALSAFTLRDRTAAKYAVLLQRSYAAQDGH